MTLINGSLLSKDVSWLGCPVFTALRYLMIVLWLKMFQAVSLHMHLSAIILSHPLSWSSPLPSLSFRHPLLSFFMSSSLLTSLPISPLSLSLSLHPSLLSHPTSSSTSNWVLVLRAQVSPWRLLARVWSTSTGFPSSSATVGARVTTTLTPTATGWPL